ncbi:MAG: leucine-rich repeat protein [Muribaculaceae bacterium]|nr:leucine-rich repeat protein [Muribaculaceae bacterium]
MRTRILSAIIITTLAFLLPMQTLAYDFMVDDLCYNKNSDGTSVTVTYQRTSNPRYTNLPENLIIPASVTYDGVTYSVTKIGDNAFARCEGLKSATIGNSVTSIGSLAFNTCSSLTSVTIPNSVTSISSQAIDN